MKNKVYILLDRSGSMGNLWEEALNSINSYVKEVGDAEIMLVAFDTEEYLVLRNTTTKNWVNVTRDEIQPRGTTPLLDASGRIMWNMLDSGASRAVLIVMTDGYENSSVKFNATEIKKMVKHLTEKKKYEIVFLGANFDKIGDVAAQSYGITDSSKFMASSVRGLASSMTATATASAGYFNTGGAMNYSEADKKAASQ